MSAPQSRERGFALPLAIFFMAILTLLLTAAFAKVQGDRRVADSSGAAVTARAVAQSALQIYIGAINTRPVDGDSIRINTAGGYADVVARIMIRTDTFSPVYVVRSTGRVIDPSQGSDPVASHVIAQFVLWRNAGNLSTYPDAFNAVGGLNGNPGGNVTVVGTDSAGCGAANRPNNEIADRNGAVNPSYVFNRNSFNNTAWPGVIGVDWQAVLGGVLTPDYSTLTNLNSWSSYFIPGNAVLSSSGNGLLAVRDTLFINGANITWAGVVLVGKVIVFNANSTTISGVAATGLDRLLGGGNFKTTLGGAGKSQFFYHNSCNIRHALQYMTGFVPIPNGLVGNWGTY